MDRTVREVQGILAQLAEMFLGVEDLLGLILEVLPESPERDAMEEGEIPMDVATDIRGALECVIADDLRPAIRTLEDAASVTDEQLRGEWLGRRSI